MLRWARAWRWSSGGGEAWLWARRGRGVDWCSGAGALEIKLTARPLGEDAAAGGFFAGRRGGAGRGGLGVDLRGFWATDSLVNWNVDVLMATLAPRRILSGTRHGREC